MTPVLPIANWSSGKKVEKTVSNMFFCVERLTSNTNSGVGASAATSTVVSSLPGVTNEGVIAADLIPANTLTLNISTWTLMSSKQDVSNGVDYCKVFQGHLISVTTQDSSWVQKIKLSSDVYSYNVLFEVNKQRNCSTSVCLRVTKDIKKGDELLAWFSEEMALLMSIPFLTPNNIEGNKRYTCHICKKIFETPNPLKVHLALACNRYTLDVIWTRLHYALKARDYANISVPTFPTTSLLFQTGRPSSLSAFKPIAQTMATYFPGSLDTSRHLASLATTSPDHLPSSSLPPPSRLQSIIPLNSVETAAQIEAIVSNMGTSKQGHLCIYCGKVYSRKYGLKIHIRTHTGFKPLKCKFCFRPFGDPSNLNKHVRLHLHPGTSTYKCHLCNKTLARRRDLQRHMESRHSNSTEERGG